MKAGSILLVVAFLCLALMPAAGGEGTGEVLYRKYCSACHPNVREFNRATNIIGKIRRPTAIMPAFDRSRIPDADAAKIEDFIVRQSRARQQPAEITVQKK